MLKASAKESRSQAALSPNSNWIVMAPLLEKSATEELQQLSGLSGWLSSFSVVLQAIVSTPLESSVYLLLLSLEEFNRVNSLSGLIQTMALLYITRKVVQLSYLELVPSAKQFPLLLPASPIERMASVTGLWLIGSTYFSLFLVVPGIWFAIASCLAQQFFYNSASYVATTVHIAGAVCLTAIGLATQVMATRIFVYLMHKSGRSTAIETKIAQQQVA